MQIATGDLGSVLTEDEHESHLCGNGVTKFWETGSWYLQQPSTPWTEALTGDLKSDGKQANASVQQQEKSRCVCNSGSLLLGFSQVRSVPGCIE